MSGSQTELLLVCCFTLLCWLVAALMVKPLLHLWERREEYWFANRHPSATWVIISATLLYISFARPLEVLYQYFSLGHDTEDAAFITGFVYQSLDAPLFYSIAFGHCIRYWIIYFDTQIAVQCSDQRWKELLLVAPEKDSHFDWFTAHKLTFGSWNYLKKIAAVLVVTLFSVTVVMYWTANKYVQMVHLTSVLFILIFLARVSTKLPHYCDTIKARAEYVLYLKAFVPGFFVYAAIVAVSFYKPSFMASLSQQFFSLLTMSLALAITVVWTPRQFSQLQEWQLSKSNQIPSEKTSDKLRLSQLLSQTDGFRAFMEHLFSEFSYENLLCCVELLQFQKLYKAKIQDTFNVETDIGRLSLHFPEEIMRLPTIATNESESFEQRFLQLSDKYLLASASMPVNLSSGRRLQLEAITEELRSGEKQGIDHTVFDNVLVALFRVMSDSYSRFVFTPAYKALVQQCAL